MSLAFLARQHTSVAIGVLREIAEHGESEAPCVADANSLLGGGHGKRFILGWGHPPLEGANGSQRNAYAPTLANSLCYGLTG
jgi:hypothetical protein